jgi:NADPH:quinone reductase-like Zn-dependent oxidoreductase
MVIGLEGVGEVVDIKGDKNKDWMGKRVSFSTRSGSWASYTAVSPEGCFEIEQDVPLGCAASGVVNPLTALGQVEHFRSLKGKGIIHTAAASSLGRMLNRLCQKEAIPLLNIVRREEQAELLKKEGAAHVLVTNGEWQHEFK